MILALHGEGAEAANPFAAGLISAVDMPKAFPPTPLWYGIYPGRVTLLIGETGAGKSSLLMNIAVHAALCERLWDFRFLRALRVLYIDPENSGNYRDGEKEGGLCRAKIERIGKGCPEGLYFHDGRGVNLSHPAHMAHLKEVICSRHIDLVILDPIANLFNTKDENSNAEAAQQGKTLTTLSRETRAAVVAAHHTGKDTLGNYGRGASARLGAADVGIVFRARGDASEQDDTFTGDTRQRSDICRVQIVKDRPNFFGPCSKYLRMAGDDRFELATFDAWKGAGRAEKADKTAQAKEEITCYLQDGEERTRSDIHKAMELEGIGRNATDEALKALEAEKVVTVRHGARGLKYYRIARTEGSV